MAQRSRSNLNSRNRRSNLNINSRNEIGNNNNSSSDIGVKRRKRSSWGVRERSKMCFCIVIAFFAFFGVIIITEQDYEPSDADFPVEHTNRMIQNADNKIEVQDYLSGEAINSDDNDHTDNYSDIEPIPNDETLDAYIEETLPHYPIGILPTDGIWQVVNGTRFKFLVYSAYYDNREGRIIRIIGATKTFGPEQIWCRLWYSYQDHNNNNRTKYYSATVTGTVKRIREHFDLKYSACFVICPLKAPGLELTPKSVSIVHQLRAPPGNILLIRNTEENIKKYNSNEEKIGICMKPFHFNYDKALYLMEYIELNTLLGISYFTFYNHTLGPHATCVLKHYINGDIPDNLTAFDNSTTNNNINNGGGDGDGINFDTNNLYKYKDNSKINNSSNSNITKTKISTLNNNNKRKSKFYRKIKLQLKSTSTVSQYIKPTINILPWDLRMRSPEEIRIEGIFAALNDCLYRNMYSYKYLALIDLDEFIIPRYNQTILELLTWLNHHYTSQNTGAYSFKNAFFYLQFPDDLLIYDEKSSENAQLRASLVTQRKTRRRSRLHRYGKRSKYICKPETVVEAGNHFVWDFLPGKREVNVPPHMGISHHYRICEYGGDDCIKSRSLIDRTATKYMKRLVNRVNNVYNYLKKPCNLDNIPPLPIQPPTIRNQIKKAQFNLDPTIDILT